jgi:hypothetical protein
MLALAIGLPIAFALAKFATSLLYGVRPHDAVTFTIVPLFLVVTALLAMLDSRAACGQDRSSGRTPMRVRLTI